MKFIKEFFGMESIGSSDCRHPEGSNPDPQAREGWRRTRGGPLPKGNVRRFGANGLLFTGVMAVLAGLFGVTAAQAQPVPYSVIHACPQDAPSGLHTITITNNTGTSATFDVLFVSPGGATQQRLATVGPNTTQPFTYGTGSLSDFPEGNTVGVSINGQAVPGGNFVFDCTSVPPTTTAPPTSTAPTTAPPTTALATAPTTTAPTTAAPTIVSGAAGSRRTAVSSSPKSLPRTGGDQHNLALVGLALITLGAVIIGSLRITSNVRRT